jgi:hypothetical protein
MVDIYSIVWIHARRRTPVFLYNIVSSETGDFKAVNETESRGRKLIWAEVLE